MRRRIDMTEVEAATKIRAKYLRALENEEWDLLPGPTFVKTFLRTYAEYLELDPRLLVEEYRQRYERPSTQDLTPFGPGHGRPRRRRQRPRRLARAVPRRAARHRRCCSARCTCSACGATTPDRRRRRVATTTPTATATADAREEVVFARRSSRPRRRACHAEADRDVLAGLRVRRRRDRQAGRQRRLPRPGQEHQDVPLAALPRRTSATATCACRSAASATRRPTSASRSATRSARAAARKPRASLCARKSPDTAARPSGLGRSAS